MRIIWARARLLACHVVLVFASCLRRSELSPVTSLNFIDQLVLHSVPRLVRTWAWNYFSHFHINQSWESSLLLFVLFYCFGLEYSWLNLLIVLSRAYIPSLLLFLPESLGGNPERRLLPMGVELFVCNQGISMNLIGPWTWSGVINVLYGIFIWVVTISDISWGRCFFWEHSAFRRVLADSRLLYLLEALTRDEPFPLVHGP